jgi:hypothetical protein
MQLVGVPLAVLALILGWHQLRKAATTARVQILLALDERLSGYEEVRAELNNMEPVSDLVQLRRYIAAFERVGHALELKEVDLKKVHEFYRDRFGKLATYLCGCEDARKIVENREGWKDFYRLWERLSDYPGNNGKVPEPPMEPGRSCAPEDPPTTSPVRGSTTRR